MPVLFTSFFKRKYFGASKRGVCLFVYNFKTFFFFSNCFSDGSTAPYFVHLWSLLVVIRGARFFVCPTFFFIAQMVKNPPAVQETWFDSWVRKICWRRDRLLIPVFLGFPCGSSGKKSSRNVGELGSIFALGRSPGEGKG